LCRLSHFYDHHTHVPWSPGQIILRGLRHRLTRTCLAAASIVFTSLAKRSSSVPGELLGSGSLNQSGRGRDGRSCRCYAAAHGNACNLQHLPPRCFAANATRSGHPDRLTPAGAGVDGVRSELLLDAHQLVVLGVAIGSAGRAGLDLPGAEADGDVGDGGVLGLTRAVRAPAKAQVPSCRLKRHASDKVARQARAGAGT